MVALKSPGPQVPRQTRGDETISKSPFDSDDVGPGACAENGQMWTLEYQVLGALEILLYRKGNQT